MNLQYLPELILVAAAIVTAQFVLAPWIPRAFYQEMIDKNPLWARAHSDLVQSLAPNRFLKPASYLVGTALLISSVPALESDNPLLYLTFICVFSFLSIAVVVLAYDGKKLIRLNRLVPDGDVREADLVPRKLTGYVPRSIAHGGLALFAMSVIGWTVFFLLDVAPTDDDLFRGALVSTFVCRPRGTLAAAIPHSQAYKSRR